MNNLGLDKDLVINMYETMLKIRLFETTQKKVYKTEQEGFTHVYTGEEAIATGACANLNKDDYITSTHRGHGHVIAKGGEMKRMMAELYGRIDGYCKGKSGSLHIADFSIGVLGANGIVGGGIPIATGAGYSIRLRDTSQVVVCFFGDGAVTQGTFHESVNMAAAWDLPVIFVIENNLYMVGTFTERVCKVCQEYSLKAPGYGIPGEDIDGNDVITVYKSVKKAVHRARKGKGPTLLNCHTYRHDTHFVGDLDTRDKDEIDYWMAKDPIKNLEKQMLEAKIIDKDMIKDHWKRIQEEVDKAVDFARKSPVPSQEIAMEDVFAE